MYETLRNEGYKYIGWVPCLNGQLVFDLIECGLKDNNFPVIEVIYYGKDNDDNIIEYILVNSTVYWKDFGDKNENGFWRVVLLSKRNITQKTHKGSVYLKPKKESPSKTWESAINKINSINSKTKNEEEPNLITEFKELQTEIDLVSEEKGSQCIKVSFNLDQDGIVHLKNCNDIYKDDLNSKLLTRQAYYYIKYTWHRHQHHDSRSETLTTTHEFDLNTTNEEIAEKLISDLKRNLVRFKRSIDHSSHREVLKAKGIVSYAKSLVEIMQTKGFIEEDFYKREISHLDYFKDSLEIISAGIEKDILMHNRSVNDARALVLFIFAIMTPAIVVNREALVDKFASSNLPIYVKLIGDIYSDELNFSIFIFFICLSLIVFISLQTRYGNFWIFFGCIKKPVKFIIDDTEPHRLLSNTNVISVVLMSLGLLFAFGFLFHIILYL